MKRALVLGDATCVHDDAALALAMFTPDATFATNNIGIYWPHDVDVWCTLHPTRCADWIGIMEARKKRVADGRNCPETWGHRPTLGIDCATQDWGGSTGLLCVKVALEQGYQRIVLAGMPMTREGGHYYDRKIWPAAQHFHAAWHKHLVDLAPYVRSCSGWTRALLGEPTREWLSERAAQPTGERVEASL